MTSPARARGGGPEQVPKGLSGATAAFSQFIRLARPEWPSLLLATFFLAIGSLAGLLYPQAMRVIIDEAIGGRLPGRINRTALVLVAIFVVQGVAIGLRYRWFSIAGERAVARLRRELFFAILSQEIAFFDERKTGELTHRIASDTTLIQGMVSGDLSMLLRNLATAIGGVTFLVYTSPGLTLWVMALVPPVALGAVAYGRRVRGLSRKVQDALARSNEVGEEAISGIRTVRSFAAEEAERDRYEVAIGEGLDLAKRRITAGATFMAVASIAAYASAALVLWRGGRMVLAGEITAGALTSFLVYSLLVAVSIGTLSELWADFMRATGAGQRVFELLERSPKMTLRGGAKLRSVAGWIRFEQVGFAYPTRPDVPVLNQVDLTIAPGEAIALVGPSGAGKSTVAALIGRLYDPTAGRILLDGVDLRSLDPGWLRRQIGVVAQDPVLFSASIADNLRYGRPDATPEQIDRVVKSANVDEFLARFPSGLSTPVGERGVQLSGGQKQRLAIARALLMDPPILVLDEATSALDSQSEQLVRDALKGLMRGRTTLIIAHRLSTIQEARRVVVLDRGRVVQAGDHATLLAQPGLYRSLVEAAIFRPSELEDQRGQVLRARSAQHGGEIGG